MKKEQENGVGRAYGFFYSSASYEEMQKLLPKVREAARTPSNMSLEIKMGINPEDFKDDSELRDLSKMAISQENNYAIRAILPDATNKRTAGELVDVLNTYYDKSPIQHTFHKDGEKFVGGIVYKEGNIYEFLE